MMEAQGKGLKAKERRFAPLALCLSPFTLNLYY
jgi:hypothetical protein